MSPIHLLWACILTHRHLNGASVVCLTLKFILTFLSPSSPQHSFPWLDPYSPSIRQWPQPHFCTHSLQAPLWDFYFPPSSMFPPQGSFTEASGNPSSHFLKEVDLPCPEYPHGRFMLLLLSRFSCVWLCATPQMAAHQALPSLGFSRQEHWSGLPFPSPTHESEKWKSLSRVLLLVTPWTAAHRAPPSMGFSRQECWSRVFYIILIRLKNSCTEIHTTTTNTINATMIISPF